MAFQQARQSHRAPMRGARGRQGTPTSTRDGEHPQDFTELQHDRWTYYGPRKPVEGASIGERYRYIDTWDTAINNGNAPAQSKLTAFASLFAVGGTKLREVKDEVLPLIDVDNPTLDVGRAGWYLTDPVLVDAQGSGDPVARHFYDNSHACHERWANRRPAYRFLAAHLTIVSPVTIPGVTIPTFHDAVYITLPQVPDGLLGSTIPAPQVTMAAVRNPTQLVRDLRALANGTSPTMGLAPERRNGPIFIPDDRALKAKIVDYAHGIMWESIRPKIKAATVGNATDAEITADLTNLRQWYYDKPLRRTVKRPLDIHHELFVVQLNHVRNLQCMDFANTFFRSLDDALQRKMEADGFRLSAFTAADAVHVTLGRVEEVFQAAAAAEKDAEATRNLAANSPGPQVPAYMGRPGHPGPPGGGPGGPSPEDAIAAMMAAGVDPATAGYDGDGFGDEFMGPAAADAAPPAAPASTAPPSPALRTRRRARRADRDALRSLYSAIEASRDRLFFARYTLPGATLPSWFLVAADLENTDPERATRLGEYECRWYIGHPDDRAEPQESQRYWPELRKVLQGGRLSKAMLTRPDRVRGFLAKNPAWAWCAGTIDLAENRLVGPFNFRLDGKAPRCSIPANRWAELAAVGANRGVRVGPGTAGPA